jgi:hypothetical protein
MKIGVLVLAVFVFYALAPEVGLAGQSALVGAKSGKGQSWDPAVSEDKKARAVGLAQNARVNNSLGETAKVTGRSNVSQLATTKKAGGLVSPLSVGSAFSQRSNSNAVINGSNIARVGSGPAIIGGLMRNTGAIDGTTFRHKGH